MAYFHPQFVAVTDFRLRTAGHSLLSSMGIWPTAYFLHGLLAIAYFHQGLQAMAYFHPQVASHGILSSRGSKTTLHGPHNLLLPRNFVHRVQGDPGYHNNRKWLLVFFCLASNGSRYIGDKHLATQHTNKPSHVLCSGQRSAGRLPLYRRQAPSNPAYQQAVACTLFRTAVRRTPTFTFDARVSSKQTSTTTCLSFQLVAAMSGVLRSESRAKTMWQGSVHPRGCPLDSLVPCQFRLVFGPGHSVFLFSFSFGFEDQHFLKFTVHRQRFSLATAVGLLCDDYWTGCVDGRHIISSRAMSEDNQRCQWRR